jgi:2-polyprenyl-6-hydroxyphenyl methylase/3-demethylubiquinone-9 3-methyltransferase
MLIGCSAIVYLYFLLPASFPPSLYIISHDIRADLIYNRVKGGLVGYYSEKLSAARLRLAYEIAPPRVRQYLRAEINHVRSKIRKGDSVLDLGCGYGRALPSFSRTAGLTFGIDSSLSSLRSALGITMELPKIHIACMDAVCLAFADNTFDKIVCIQNGISAFHVDQRELIRETIRVARPGGVVFFSTYSEKFWDQRLEWFRLQSAAGLLGEIDMSKTGNGVIACKDGFTATTVTPEDFARLTSEFDMKSETVEVDESSVFFEISV